MSGTKADRNKRWKVFSISFGTTERRTRAKLSDWSPSSYVKFMPDEDLSRDAALEAVYGRDNEGLRVERDDGDIPPSTLVAMVQFPLDRQLNNYKQRSQK